MTSSYSSGVAAIATLSFYAAMSTMLSLAMIRYETTGQTFELAPWKETRTTMVIKIEKLTDGWYEITLLRLLSAGTKKLKINAQDVVAPSSASVFGLEHDHKHTHDIISFRSSSSLSSSSSRLSVLSLSRCDTVSATDFNHHELSRLLKYRVIPLDTSPLSSDSSPGLQEKVADFSNRGWRNRKSSAGDDGSDSGDDSGDDGGGD